MGKNRGHTWVFTEEFGITITADRSRGQAVVGLHCPYFDILIVTDGYASYNRFSVRQRYGAHLLRDAGLLAAIHGGGMAEMHQRLQSVFHNARRLPPRHNRRGAEGADRRRHAQRGHVRAPGVTRLSAGCAARRRACSCLSGTRGCPHKQHVRAHAAPRRAAPQDTAHVQGRHRAQTRPKWGAAPHGAQQPEPVCHPTIPFCPEGRRTINKPYPACSAERGI